MVRLTRREMLKLLGLAGAGGWLGVFDRLIARAITPDDAPLAASAPALQAGGTRVIHMHDPAATSWDFTTGAFYQYVDQNVVGRMVDEGLMRLTGTASRQAAWIALIPAFAAGQTIAIKVNFNNYIGGAGLQSIGAVIEPVNALIAGLLERGFAAADIYVYDVTDGWHQGAIPTSSFASRCLYPGVQFVGYVNDATSFNAAERIVFNLPAGAPAGDPLRAGMPVATVLTNATYLINMPILKVHPFTGVTLGLKNHYGSFENCQETHRYLALGDYPNQPPTYDPTYSPLIDINNNANIRGKTVLVVGDGLFGANQDPIGPPRRWTTFGNDAPNSLFFATDPLAIESVMTDIIAAETRLGTAQFPDPYGYLQLAQAAGLGVHERGNPWASSTGNYTRIGYLRVSPGITPPPIDPGGSSPGGSAPSPTSPPTNTPDPTPTASPSSTSTPTSTPASLSVVDASAATRAHRSLPATGYPASAGQVGSRGVVAVVAGAFSAAAALLVRARGPKDDDQP